jgi:hypothetical protein
MAYEVALSLGYLRQAYPVGKSMPVLATKANL